MSLTVNLIDSTISIKSHRPAEFHCYVYNMASEDMSPFEVEGLAPSLHRVVSDRDETELLIERLKYYAIGSKADGTIIALFKKREGNKYIFHVSAVSYKSDPYSTTDRQIVESYALLALKETIRDAEVNIISAVDIQ